MSSRRNIFLRKALPLWLLGIAAAALITVYALTNLNAPPKILRSPQSADICTDALMEQLCQGEFDSLGQYLYGSPDLGLGQEPEDTVGSMVWEAWLQSLSYEFDGRCYATQAGLARDLRFTCLDVSAVIDSLEVIAQEVFSERLDSIEDQDLIYDAQNSYREDFIQSIIEESVQRALAEHSALQESAVSVQLAYDRGQWLVVADTNFLNAVFGEITG